MYNYQGSGRSRGNQLQQVSDQSPSLNKDQGYRQEGVTPSTYAYNQNGNITFDAHRNVSLQYNQFLNLKTRVEKTTTEYIDYTLDVMGNRLAKKVVENGEVTRHLHYIGSCVYNFTTLQYYLFAEGRARVTDNGFTLEYHIKDHLGNVRVMFEEDEQTGEAVITQENHYYPYGMRMEGVVNNQPTPTDVNTWLFNGQEFQNELGLDWYAFDLRCIDPAVGRWFEQDPYDQFFSPYCGIGNNPVNYTDPTGGMIGGGPTGGFGGGFQSAVGNPYISGGVSTIARTSFYNGKQSSHKKKEVTNNTSTITHHSGGENVVKSYNDAYTSGAPGQESLRGGERTGVYGGSQNRPITASGEVVNDFGSLNQNGNPSDWDWTLDVSYPNSPNENEQQKEFARTLQEGFHQYINDKLKNNHCGADDPEAIFDEFVRLVRESGYQRIDNNDGDSGIATDFSAELLQGIISEEVVKQNNNGNPEHIDNFTGGSGNDDSAIIYNISIDIGYSGYTISGQIRVVPIKLQ